MAMHKTVPVVFQIFIVTPLRNPGLQPQNTIFNRNKNKILCDWLSNQLPKNRTGGSGLSAAGVNSPARWTTARRGQRREEAATGLTQPELCPCPDQGRNGPWKSALVALGASELVLSIGGQLAKNRLTKEKSNGYLRAPIQRLTGRVGWLRSRPPGHQRWPTALQRTDTVTFRAAGTDFLADALGRGAR